jgi:DNA-binding LacI/PurR family transcriptional regulator
VTMESGSGRRESVGVGDVASHAGVSAATVSRVLGGRVPVAAETRAKVLQAVERLGYRPNAIARSLRSGRGHAVALVTGDIEQGIYATLAKHLQAALESAGLDLLLFNLGHDERRLIHVLDSAPLLGLRGILLASPHLMTVATVGPAIRHTQELGIEVVSLSQDLSAEGVPSIIHDDRGGAAMAARHLAQRGRLPLAFVGRVETSAVGRARFEGCRSALAEMGAAPPIVLDIAHGYRAEAGYGAVAQALEAGPLFRSVLAASDELALGAAAAVLDRGLSIPDDVAIVGFGGLSVAGFFRPALTSVLLDVAALAKAVGDHFAEADIESTRRKRHVVLAHLDVRQSA